MNALTKIEPATGLALLRAPFPPNQISKLPKPTKQQTEAVKNDFKKGVRCKICGTWHHPEVIHLDYVGHAALTDRLLDADPAWSWEPLATNEGLPALDRNGGLWIKLTVCGITRLGYGSADGKSGGDAVKEIIGDALRNAAMRFGAALDLWHKGDLHADDEPAAEQDRPTPQHDPATPALITDAQRQELMTLATAKNIDARTLCEVGKIDAVKNMPAGMFDKAKQWIAKQPKRELAPAGGQASDIIDDDILY
ncbi:hypothetical protein [Sphingomonas beigongshangi]|uniref:hypothetical protein n=1 Tax=Sphingomonas beigongshangi TaxID=2782540 RepID=UPI00193AF6C4|nr:hypothetical protein [Sphingomonas beigongshangi]